ncbi:MAG: DUF5700 domain-containing putative Zn-dependent protease [Bacillota bacterium]
MVPVDLTSVRLMLVVLEDLAAGRTPGAEQLAELYASPGYDFYLRFHTKGNWEDPFSRELLTEMMLSLPDRPYTAPGPRLDRIRRRFAHGLGRLPELKETLRALEAADLGESERRALSFLPHGAVIEASISYLLDGFNAGTAIGHEVTVDLLAMFPDTVQAITIPVAAHELHHIGYDSVRRKDAATTALADGPWNHRLVARLVDDLLGEGSATHYCDPPTDILHAWLSRAFVPALAEQMRAGLRTMEERVSAEMVALEGLLRRLLDAADAGESEQEALKNAVASYGYSEELPQAWAHYLGSRMVKTIDLAFGDRAALRAIANLGEFLRMYNEAAKELGPGRGLGHAFDQGLVGDVIDLWRH